MDILVSNGDKSNCADDWEDDEDDIELAKGLAYHVGQDSAATQAGAGEHADIDMILQNPKTRTARVIISEDRMKIYREEPLARCAGESTEVRPAVS